MTAPGKRIGIKVRSAVFSVGFSQDGSSIVGGCLDKRIRKWGIDGKEIGKVEVGSAVRSVAVSKDGRWIVCGGDGGLATVCDGSTHEKVIEVKGHTFGVVAVDISPNSKMFATGSHDQTAIIWDTRTGQKLVGPLEHNGVVSGVSFAPDGERIATATCQDDSSIRIFDSRNGKLFIHIPDAVRSLHSTPITWSNDGRHIFSVYYGQIKRLDASTGSLLSEWTVHGGHNFASIALSRNGRFIAYSTAMPGLVSLWDTATHAQLGSVIEHSGDVRSIAISPDGSWLAAGQYDNKITLRNLTGVLPDSFVSQLGPSSQMSPNEEEPNSPQQNIVRHSHGTIPFQTPLIHVGNASQLCKESNDDMGKVEKPETNPDIVMKLRQTVSAAIEEVIRDLPRVLIDTTSGLLRDKVKQRTSFEESETYKELITSMTTRINQDYVQQTVAEYYKYAMLSHTWDGDEPLFQTVESISIYDLLPSLTRDKLRMFCSCVRDTRLRWAWSDTCCIDKKDIVILQESLVSMFKWYRGSALTIVYLRGVGSKSGSLVDSPWNTRAWTNQEYVAAKIIQFYTENWTPYLNLPVFDDDHQIFNHKTAPEIVQEMSQVVQNQIGEKTMSELHPGLDHIREKLCLASTRQASFIEDTAYSLFGILSISIPVKYGEREEALGRFLAEVLMSSRDMSILAWTGESSTYNSCLPARITAFKELATSYLPSPLDDVNMERIVSGLRTRRRKRDVDAAIRLYDRLKELPRPSFIGRCMNLPCITFPLTEVTQAHAHEPSVYHATALGNVEIKSREDLSGMKLVLVHPWIDYLLDREGDDDAETLLAHRKTRAFRLVARLKWPFGALLLARRSNKIEYKRVATGDSKIVARVQENADLALLLSDVRTLEVL